jgi:mono/diheme cytochrome c family protein
MGRRTVWILAFLFVLAGFAWLAAAPAAAQSRVEYVYAQRVMPPHGPDLYQHYCAACHGPTGLGNGPAARLVKSPVPNLTLIAVRDNGFDPVHVTAHIRGAYVVDPMPDWHSVLRTTYDSDAMERLIARNLSEYVESLQAKQ